MDENLGRRSADVLRAAGHDVATVPEEALSSAEDAEVLNASASEGRCLVTLDIGFRQSAAIRAIVLSWHRRAQAAGKDPAERHRRGSPDACRGSAECGYRSQALDPAAWPGSGVRPGPAIAWWVQARQRCFLPCDVLDVRSRRDRSWRARTRCHCVGLALVVSHSHSR